MVTKVDAKSAGERLRKLRDIRTRTGVAAAVGCSVSAMASYEAGERVPRDEIKCRIADYYGVSVESIWYRREA